MTNEEKIKQADLFEKFASNILLSCDPSVDQLSRAANYFTVAENLRRLASPKVSRDNLASVIHDARWKSEDIERSFPFEAEDQRGKDYCYRIADAVLDYLKNNA